MVCSPSFSEPTKFNWCRFNVFISVLFVVFITFMCYNFTSPYCPYGPTFPYFSVNSTSVSFLNGSATITDYAIVTLDVIFNVDIYSVPYNTYTIYFDSFHILVFHDPKNVSCFTSEPFLRHPCGSDSFQNNISPSYRDPSDTAVIHARFEAINITFDERVQSDVDTYGTCGIAFIDFVMKGNISYDSVVPNNKDLTQVYCNKMQLKLCSNNTFTFKPSPHGGCNAKSAYVKKCEQIDNKGPVAMFLFLLLFALILGVYCGGMRPLQLSYCTRRVYSKFKPLDRRSSDIFTAS